VNGDSLQALAVAEVGHWTGLAPGTTVDDLVAAGLPVDREVTGTGRLGSERCAATWYAVESTTYEGGLRVWERDGEVVLLEGRLPVDEDDEPQPAPTLGEPEITFDTHLSRVRIEDGERAYPARGLTVVVNTDNDLLLSVVAFVPTTADDYRRTLRPESGPPERLVPSPNRRQLR
jgi:hypothetical protein